MPGFRSTARDGEGNPIISQVQDNINYWTDEINESGSGATTDPALNVAITNASKMIGQQLWNIKVTFRNHLQEYDLATHAIKLLEIDESDDTWPLRGSIVVDNRLEGFERSIIGDDYFYHVRGDARDEIDIEIWPTLDGDFPDEVWKIGFKGVIYDVEDLPHEDMTTKVKKFYFWDKRFEMMNEKVCEWSTATGVRLDWAKLPEPPPEPIAHATDEQRSMYTGDAIASLLVEAGYGDLIDKDKWDRGSSKILFNAKAGMTIHECIKYIESKHICDNKYDISAGLHFLRGEQKFTLRSYGDLFDLAGKGSADPGELQREHLFFEEYGSAGEPESTSPYKAPYLIKNNKVKDIKISEYNTILAYRFSQTAGLDNAKAFLTRPVYSHYHKGKQFQVDIQENEISNVKAYFKKHYVEKLLGNNYPVMTLNRTKTEEQSIDPCFSPSSTLDPVEDRLSRGAEGRAKTLYAGIFLNQTLTVRLQGSTHRIAGTFIAVDRLTEDSDNDYDYQLCGQYYVAKVSHIFRHQKYVNDLVLVKVHAYDKLKDNEDVY